MRLGAAKTANANHSIVRTAAKLGVADCVCDCVWQSKNYGGAAKPKTPVEPAASGYGHGEDTMSGFFEELQRRKVYRVAAAYIVVAGFLIQIASAAFPAWELPNWSLRLVIALLLIGFPIALILAWAYDVTPQGIQATARVPGAHRHRNLILLVVASAIISTAAGFFLLQRASAHKIDKSIAVLPFTSLSQDKSDAYFADGVQDQILTNITKVSDLKVISHTSVRQYKSGGERNMREIGRQLGVAYIMEGRLPPARDHLRINATLIDARTDAHVWAETYDRTVADLFAIQSELAQSIVAQLKAKLSPQQKVEIEERPTKDLDAFELYVQAKAIIDSYINATDVRAALLQALKSLDEAMRQDPNFVSAYWYGARANDLLFFFDLDARPDRISLADAAVKAALRLRPDSAEAHFARADYSTPFFILSGYSARRRNHFRDAEQDFSTAFALDPRNPNAYNLLADTYV